MQHSAFNSKFTRADIIQLWIRFMTVAAELNAQVDEPAVKNHESWKKCGNGMVMRAISKDPDNCQENRRALFCPGTPVQYLAWVKCRIPV